MPHTCICFNAASKIAIAVVELLNKIAINGPLAAFLITKLLTGCTDVNGRSIKQQYVRTRVLGSCHQTHY